MLDVKRIRQDPQELRQMLINRNMDPGVVDSFLVKDELRRKLLSDVEEKKALRNQTSKQIGQAKRKGAGESEMAAIMEDMRTLGDAIAGLDAQIAEIAAIAGHGEE